MAGVDLPNQFPNSRMAGAVRQGQSRFMSVDQFGLRIRSGAQINLNISGGGGTALTVPPTTGDTAPVSYAIVVAVGGPMYVTYDGSVPSAVNYQQVVQAGNSLPIQGPQALAAARLFGTTASVSYWN